MGKISENAFFGEGAIAVGDVSIGSGSSLWYHAVLRADHEAITVGERTNLQEGAVVHVDPGFPVTIADGVTVGHGAILHGCKIGENTMIGMGAIILNGAKIGRDCLIGAGTLIPGGMEVPDGSVVFGNPGRIRREMRAEEIEANRESAAEYMRDAEKFLTGRGAAAEKQTQQ